MESEIRKAIEKVLQELGTGDVQFSVEHPADLSHGDYATNVAMVIAKQVKKNLRSLKGQNLIN